MGYSRVWVRKGGFIYLEFSKVPCAPNLIFGGKENGIFICHWKSLETERSILQAKFIRFLFLMFLLVILLLGF